MAKLGETRQGNSIFSSAERSLLPGKIPIWYATPFHHRLVDAAGPGNVLFFLYSGHGTCILSVEPSHYGRVEEAIVPCDFNLITDFDFRQLPNRLPKEASFTILSDSCHSGEGADRACIGEPRRTPSNGPRRTSSHRPRRPSLIQRGRPIPIDYIVIHLSSLSGISSPQIADHLSHLFGEEASPKLRKKEVALPVGANKAILLCGCQANETSAETNPSLGGGKSHEGALSNRELVLGARQLVRKQEFEQHPCLYCSDENADAPFLQQLAH
ncbi:metacaspase-9-like [Aristolochia californica]|uniref:metacaspase-9-like n=1 Tax=Aristolochia californica TaxID=171875 RepID=UPI0035D8364F